MKNRLLLFLFLLPLLWVGTSNSHDWGDDFSQYLLQAKNLIQDRPQTNQELVFAEGELPYAIVAYPVGFPILLAPFFDYFGLYIPPYLLLNAFFIILTTLFLFDYLKSSFDIKYSFCISPRIFYNTTKLNIKFNTFAYAFNN